MNELTEALGTTFIQNRISISALPSSKRMPYLYTMLSTSCSFTATLSYFPSTSGSVCTPLTVSRNKPSVTDKTLDLCTTVNVGGYIVSISEQSWSAFIHIPCRVDRPGQEQPRTPSSRFVERRVR
jgi:hypothetical protein